MADQVRVDTVEGTGAAINIELGWIPDYVRIINVEDGDTIHEWFRGMGAGDAIKAINVVDNATSGANGLALISANGIDTYSADDAEDGFTIGTDISESGKTLRYIAMRNI